MDIILNEKKLPPPSNIKVSSLRTPGELLIVWDKVRNPDQKNLNDPLYNGDSFVLISKIQYNVYRGTSLGGLFYKQNATPLDNPRYDDKNVGRNPNTQYFYKVSTVITLVNNTSIEGVLSAAVIYRVTTTNKWFMKINERNMWILKNTGVLMDLYVRKTDGPRCSHCWDSLRLQGDQDCTFCFGTSFEGGYEPMTQLYVRQKPTVQQLDLTPHGYVPNNNPGAWTISDIKLTNRDLLINPEGKILSITSTNISHAAGYLFHQEINTKELDPLDKRYQIKRVTLYPSW